MGKIHDTSKLNGIFCNCARFCFNGYLKVQAQKIDICSKLLEMFHGLLSSKLQSFDGHCYFFSNLLSSRGKNINKSSIFWPNFKQAQNWQQSLQTWGRFWFYQCPKCLSSKDICLQFNEMCTVILFVWNLKKWELPFILIKRSSKFELSI